MARKKAPGIKEDVTCNLVPMVDIMFLLLLFFILGADMSQRESEDVVLPKADKVQEFPKVKDATPTTTVNLHHRSTNMGIDCAAHKSDRGCRDPDHWLLTIRGQQFTFQTAEAQLKQEAAEDPEPGPDPKNVLSARRVIIRADQAAPYGHIQKVIEICSRAKIYKIEVGAAKPEA